VSQTQSHLEPVTRRFSYIALPFFTRFFPFPFPYTPFIPLTRRGIMLSHTEPAYASCPARQALPCSEEASRRSLLLPLYPGMSHDEQETVLRHLLAQGPLAPQAQAGYSSRGGE